TTRAFWGKSPAKSDAVMPALPVAETAGPIEAAASGAAASTRASTTAAIAIIFGGGLIWLGGGGLIWLGLHYGSEFHERIALVTQPVKDKPPLALPRVPGQSLACNTVEARYGLVIDAGSSGSRIYIYCWKPAG